MRRAVRRRVEKTKDRLDLRSRHAFRKRWIDLSQHADPDLEVGALQAAHGSSILYGKVGEIVVLNSDQVTISQCEVGVKGNQQPQRVEGRLIGRTRRSLFQELLAHVDEEVREQASLLAK